MQKCKSGDPTKVRRVSACVGDERDRVRMLEVAARRTGGRKRTIGEREREKKRKKGKEREKGEGEKKRKRTRKEGEEKRKERKERKEKKGKESKETDLVPRAAKVRGNLLIDPKRRQSGGTEQNKGVKDVKRCQNTRRIRESATCTT